MFIHTYFIHNWPLNLFEMSNQASSLNYIYIRFLHESFFAVNSWDLRHSSLSTVSWSLSEKSVPKFFIFFGIRCIITHKYYSIVEMQHRHIYMTATRYAKLLIFIQYTCVCMYSGAKNETIRLNDLAFLHIQSSSVSYCLTLCAVEKLNNTTNLTTALFAFILAFLLSHVCMHVK